MRQQSLCEYQVHCMHQSGLRDQSLNLCRRDLAFRSSSLTNYALWYSSGSLLGCCCLFTPATSTNQKVSWWPSAAGWPVSNPASHSHSLNLLRFGCGPRAAVETRTAEDSFGKFVDCLWRPNAASCGFFSCKRRLSGEMWGLLISAWHCLIPLDPTLSSSWFNSPSFSLLPQSCLAASRTLQPHDDHQQRKSEDSTASKSFGYWRFLRIDDRRAAQQKLSDCWT